MRAIALGLDLPETSFDAKIHEEWHTLRLLHYPSVDSHNPTNERTMNERSRTARISHAGPSTFARGACSPMLKPEARRTRKTAHGLQKNAMDCLAGVLPVEGCLGGATTLCNVDRRVSLLHRAMCASK